MAVHCEVDGAIVVITLDRQEVANAIDRPTPRRRVARPGAPVKEKQP